MPTPYQIAKLLCESDQSGGFLLLEDYERNVNRNTVDFWRNIRNSNHPFSKHPIFAMYGDELAQEAHGDIYDRMIKAHPELQEADPEQVMNLGYQAIMKVLELEQGHYEELEDLAIRLVSEVWGVPEEMMDAKILPPQKMSGSMGSDMPNDMEVEEIKVDRDEVNKRITINALTQGAAVHNMATIHNIVKNELNDIEPRLLQLYGQHVGTGLYHYWIFDFANSTRELLDTCTVGKVNVDYGEESESETEEPGEFGAVGGFEEPEEYKSSTPKIIARAINFPVLVQELVKGVMEILSLHGLEGLDKQQLSAIYNEADRYEDEPWLLQIGPQLWRVFLKIIPRGHELSDVVMEVVKQPPKFVHKLLSDAIEDLGSGNDPERSRMSLEELMSGEPEDAEWSEDNIEDDVEEDDDWWR